MINRVLRDIKTLLIKLLTEKLTLTKDTLRPNNQLTLIYIRDFLISFFDIIKVIEGRRAILDKVLLSLDFLAEKFDYIILSISIILL